MKLTGLHIPGYRLKDGKLIPTTTKGKSVSKRIAERKSKKVKVVKRAG